MYFSDFLAFSEVLESQAIGIASLLNEESLSECKDSNNKSKKAFPKDKNRRPGGGAIKAL